MHIKNKTSSMGRPKKYIPEIYFGLKPQTLSRVNKISQAIKKIDVITEAAKKALKL